MDEGLKCIICSTRTSLIESDHFIVTQCGHIFHYECIKTWLDKEAAKCPACCTPILSKQNLVRLKDIQIQTSPPNNPYQLRLALVGSYAVGKTSILQTFTKGHFPGQVQTTIGCDLGFKTIEVAEKVFKLCIRDTGGQERYEALLPVHFRNVNGVVLVYDITQRASFEKIAKWVEAIHNYAPTSSCKILIGNKVDLENSQDRPRQVEFSEGKEFATELGMEFFETSAKEHVNVEATFRTLAATILQKQWLEGNLDVFELTDSTELESDKGKQSKCRC